MKLIMCLMVVLACVLSSCGEGFDSYECYTSVKKRYPENTHDIVRIGNYDPNVNSKYKFIVSNKKNGIIRLVMCLSLQSSEITFDEVILKPNLVNILTSFQSNIPKEEKAIESI